MTRRPRLAALATTIGVLALGAGLAPSQADEAAGDGARTGAREIVPGSDADVITKAVTPANLRGTLDQLRVAAQRYGDRAAGTEGYAAAGRFIEYELREAGYRPQRQYFTFTSEEILANDVTVAGPPEVSYENFVMTGSPSTPEGGVTATYVVPNDPEGCTAASWDGVDVTDQIALVSRGTCAFADKSTQAAAAGAAAVVIYNNTAGPLNGTLGGQSPDFAPTTGISQADGQALAADAASGTVEGTVEIVVLTEEKRTFNITAETPYGDPDNVVMIGGHLDGVEDTQAINDNGTGTAAVLETAKQMAALTKGKAGAELRASIDNKVRFAFWGAEELGLLGSTNYVNDLVANDPGELDDIATYLNFDMLGSPNYIVSAYDADGSTYDASAPVPAGSIETEQAFRKYFAQTDQPVVDSEFSGRSDYQAFIENGVASGGLFSGADGTKTPREVRLFGGEAGVTYDPNYHSPTDNFASFSMPSLHLNADAIAAVTLRLAKSTRLIDVPSPARTKPTVVAPSLPDGVVAR